MKVSLRAAVPPDAALCLRQWIEACAASPGGLPPGVELVQTRLIRTVGRGRLPGLGDAFIKVMGFPRGKDRLRYVHRALPARHESLVLETVKARAPDLPVPESLAWASQRAPGCFPRLSVLVTRGLEVDAASPTPSVADRVLAARRLCEVGIEHGDLHHGNFVRLTDGRTAALDLQSARVHGGSLEPRVCVRIAAKLIESEGDDALDAVVDGGLVAASARDAVRAQAARLRSATVERRVRRCLQESSEFAKSIGVGAVRHVRRGVAPGRALVRVQEPDALRLWIGDRVREVLDGCPPLFVGLVRPLVPQLGVRPALLLGSDQAAELLDSARPDLLAAFARYRALARLA